MQTVTQKYRRAAISDLTPHPKNPNLGDVGAIHTSIEANGFYGAILVQKSSGYILAGNHRVIAAEQAGAKQVPIMELDVDDDTALRILLADNRIAALAHNDDIQLAELLQEIAAREDLLGTGYDGDDLDQLLADIASNVDDDTERGVHIEQRGDSLDVIDVSMSDPRHQVEHGQVWRVGDKHMLVCCDVQFDWQHYIGLLTEGAVFAPYPTPMLAVVFEEAPLVMVQPSQYLAGHVLDKYASRYGDDSVRVAE